MVPSENKKVFRIADLEGKQQTNRLNRLLPAVHVVTKKEVVRFGWEAAVLEES